MQVCVMIIRNNAHVPLEVVTRVILHALGTGNHPVGNDMYVHMEYVLHVPLTLDLLQISVSCNSEREREIISPYICAYTVPTCTLYT